MLPASERKPATWRAYLESQDVVAVKIVKYGGRYHQLGASDLGSHWRIVCARSGEVLGRVGTVASGIKGRLAALAYARARFPGRLCKITQY